MPEQPEQLNKVRSLALAHASACLVDLEEAGALHRPESALVSAPGKVVLVLVLPSCPSKGVSGMTDCERDCLALLADADGSLSGERAWRRMKKGKAGLGPHGLATVKRALARLKRLGVLGNFARGRQRGYYFPERLPLFRHLTAD